MITATKSRATKQRARPIPAKRSGRRTDMDSLEQYSNPEEIKRSLERALDDARLGKLRATL